MHKVAQPQVEHAQLDHRSLTQEPNARPGRCRGAGLSGPRLTALVGYLKGACHASFSTIRKLLRDVLGLSVSRGQLAKLVQKVSASLEASYAQLRTSLPTEGRLNVGRGKGVRKAV